MTPTSPHPRIYELNNMELYMHMAQAAPIKLKNFIYQSVQS